MSTSLPDPSAMPPMPPLPSNPNENAGANIMGATIACTVLAFVTYIVRMYVRAFTVKALGLDDAFMTLAMMVSIVSSALIIASVQYGAGQHIGDVPQPTFQVGMKLNFLSQPFLMWGVCIVKLSVGCALLRIATQKRIRWSIISIMIFMVIYTAFCFSTLFTQCKSVNMQWDNSVPRNCWAPSTLQALAYTHAALNIFTDFLFAIAIPVPMLMGLNMNKKTKAAVIGVLSLGVFVCFAGIIRIPTIANYGKAGDFLWDSRGLSVWFMAEFNTGIIAGSMPALKPLFKRILDSSYIKGRSQQYGYGNNSSNAQVKHSSKGFTNIKVTERSRSDDLDDYDGANSQRDLVIDRHNIAMNVIKKDVMTSVTSVPVPGEKRERGYGWEA